ncbi:MAG: GntR family transcriptional regulator [Egibacteraceae bacterium]
MEITPPVARYQQVAAHLRTAILNGEYEPGQSLPSEADLANTYSLSRPTIRQAIAALQAEGLVTVEHGRGMFVRTPPARRATRDRRVHRDDRGYCFDPQAVNWVAVKPPTIAWVSASQEIADLLHIPVGSDVLVRDRQIGEQGGPPLQLATSYLPGPLVRDTVLEQPDTGPGGIYDRLEEMGHTLHWVERVTTRMPTPDETKALNLFKGVPLLRILRTTLNQADEPLEVNDTRMAGDQFEVAYTLERTPTAQTS